MRCGVFAAYFHKSCADGERLRVARRALVLQWDLRNSLLVGASVNDMKQLFAVALVAAVVAAPACAQHGGGGHGGGGGGFHGGGFAGHGGYAATGGFSRPMSAGVRVYAPRYGGGGGVGVASRRPSFYHGGWEWQRGHRLTYRYGAGVGYGWPGYGWVDSNDPGDDAGYDAAYDSGYDSGYDPGNGDRGPYDVGPYPEGPGVGPEGYEAQAPGGEEPAVPYAAESARTSPTAQRAPVVQPSLYADEAVTLIFKDGRAPEKITNYALTRTTLYVTDGRPQEIPVAALDLPATEKVNRAAGVRFQLPVLQ